MFKYTKNLYKIFVTAIVISEACVIGATLGARTLKKIEKKVNKISKKLEK